MAFFVISALAVTVLGAAESDPDLFTNDPFPSSQLRGADYLDADEGETGRSNKWLKDINTRTKNHFKKLLAPLQTPIVQEYQVVGILDTYANYTMELVANATGHSVIWNRTSGRGLSEPRGLRPSRQELPPRARYINQILMYLNKEMEAVWNYITMVDRKRWGVGNVITSSPYGPHGEHPERWRANGSFPLPAAAPNNTILLQSQKINLVLKLKPEIEKYDNKYAQQLQADLSECAGQAVHGVQRQTLDVYGMPAKVRYVKPLNLLCFYLNCMVQLAYGLYLPAAPLVPCNAYGAAIGVVSTLVCWWFARREAQAEDWNRKAALGTLAIAALSMLAFAYAKYVEGGAEFVGKIGIFVAFSMYGAPLASIGEVLRTQSSETLPLLQSFLGFLNSCCWLAVGLRRGATPIWIPNLVSAFLSCIQLALIYKYPVRPDKGAGEQEELILNRVEEPLCQEKESKRQAKVMPESHCLEEGGPDEPENSDVPFSI